MINPELEKNMAEVLKIVVTWPCGKKQCKYQKQTADRRYVCKSTV